MKRSEAVLIIADYFEDNVVLEDIGVSMEKVRLEHADDILRLLEGHGVQPPTFLKALEYKYERTRVVSEWEPEGSANE